MLTLKGQRPDSRSDSVETDLLLWWEDFYLPIFEYILPEMGQLEGKRVLELGAGTGGTATLLAKRGAAVVGIDLLPFRLTEAETRVSEHNVAASVDFALMDAMHLAFPDNTFDFIISKSVLVFTKHTRTAQECYRVLKPGGKAIFIENMRHHPAVWLYRKVFLRYADKLHYFSLSDVEAVGAEFEGLEHREFHLSAVSALFWRECVSIPFFYRWTFNILKAVDTVLLKCVPFLKRFCWITAVVCHKIDPKGSHPDSRGR